MTSSLRNSLHRRNHKERSQLSHRAKFGILEKHKDYVQRARDYHSKQDRITRLRQKAADRNKDEFYFGMNKERTVQGVHVKDRGNVSMPMDMVKLLKTQDEGYVRTMRANGIKAYILCVLKIERIKSQLTALANLIAPQDDNIEDDGEDALDETDLETLREAGIIPPGTKRRPPPRHIIFAENEVEGESKQLSQRQSLNKAKTTIEVDVERTEVDLGWKTVESASSRRRRKNKCSAVVSTDIVEDAEEIRQLNVQNRKRLLKELAARLKRDTQLQYTQRELEMQRLLAGKGGRRKLRGVEEVGAANDEDEDEMDDAAASKASKVDEKNYKPRVYKWRIERKR
ncbi:u3 small nucleolar RNA-associated protein 11 [Suillus fuscotomentosus]|uniref:U3 small nucleolar RNA-associated protein 11 n=1 Tax=Suillus fuscotomentosus TaxID=1912939 RepID=A0AAD4HSD4_9AGAM|nr:u3 small nucleolar RNA-associated protein 11 [Suillus fuscotomentosus]KAG1908325.1 u3 small nucleolar RNA-associated protein 11 [Suillus fuscotomentosus]